MTRLIAYLASIVGLSLMAFGIWGLQAPKKVGEVVNRAHFRLFDVTRAATSLVKNQILAPAQGELERRRVLPVSDPNFVPMTIEEKYSKYLYCMTATTPCPGFSTESEASYYLDLREQMQRELLSYYLYLKENPLKIQKADKDFAHQLLKESTPVIQAEAIKIIGLFPADDRNLHAVAKVVRGTADADVLNQGLNVLMKYRGERKYDEVIAEALAYQISRGTSDFTSTMAARRSYPFITEYNALRFRKLQQDLTYLNSRYGVQFERLRAVNLTLREFERGHLLSR